MIVVDASVIVAALTDTGTDGQWATHHLRGGALNAPHLMPVEATNVLRRLEFTGSISPETASLSYIDLHSIPVYLLPFEPFADRVWDLRSTITAYDAWYVAMAEALDAHLVTLDHRLAEAPGPTCSFITPN